MEIVNKLKGKEIIDVKGYTVGEISNVEWNPETNKIDSIIVRLLWILD
jgi:sporulation protein YlmC with PRC-barrel domain